MNTLKIQLATLALLAFVQFSCTNTTNSGIFEYDLIAVQTDDKWGYIDHTGKYIINPQFQSASAFSEGLALVQSQDGKYGYIGKNGKYLIDPVYADGTYFSEGLAFVVAEDGYPTAINKKGETKFALKEAKTVYAFHEGLANFTVKSKSEYKTGFVDKTGKITISAQFPAAGMFSEGLAPIAVKKENKDEENYGFIDKTGKIVINPQFKDASYFHEGLSRVYNGKNYGYINKEGKYVINPQFESAADFSEGLAAVKQGDMWGYINKEGKIVINPQFESAGNFSGGTAAVEISNNTCGFINKKGKYTVNPQFEGGAALVKNFAAAGSNDKIGFIDGKGNYIVNPQFENMQPACIDHVISNYYNPSDFIKAFFTRDANRKFDGFNAASTLQDIVNSSAYSDANENGIYCVYSSNHINITDEIEIAGTYFYFANPVYENINSYDNYGYYNYPSTSKEYHFSEKVIAMEYQFNLSGDAYYKGAGIANALKAEIESRYNIKLEKEGSENKYYINIDKDKFGFAIKYDSHNVSLRVLFAEDSTIAKLKEAAENQ
jgi:hypothetical protein